VESARYAATLGKSLTPPGALEPDGFKPATDCLQVADASEAQERVCEGVSAYSIGEVANVMPPAFKHREPSSDTDRYDRRSLGTVQLDEGATHTGITVYK